MFCGISTSLTSTTLTLIPQGSVCSSMMFWSSSFISSLLVRRSSRFFCPRTLLRVVWAIWLVARTWFSTSRTLLFGSTNRKEDEEPWSLGPSLYPTEAEDHTPLVLLDDLDGA